MSNTFSISNCLKYTGLLSPILFNVFLEQLINLVKQQGIDCHLHGMFVGACSVNYECRLFIAKATLYTKLINKYSLDLYIAT